MPSVWRITKHGHAKNAFTGEGARLYGGRWNSAGIPVVYTAQSQALAILEMLIHLNSSELLKKYVLFAVEIDDRWVSSIDRIGLPKNWQTYPPPPTVPTFGDSWAKSLASVALSVPSALVPGESNYLLNPQHPDFSKLKVGKPIPFQFDPRFSSKHR